MKELSLHILDIVQNSISAKATEIIIEINENTKNNTFFISISDNGCGMSEEFVKKVRDPFSTTRTTRKVGMGISLFEAAATQCGGNLDIKSIVGEGTVVSAIFKHDHIDRAPLGDMTDTLIILISGSPNIRFIYKHTVDEKTFVLDLEEIKQVLGNVPLDAPEILAWLREYINEGISEL